MREALDAKVLHDLFDLLLEVQHFGLEFCSLFFAFFASLDVGVVKEREREKREKRGASAFTKKIGVGDLFPGKSETERRRRRRKRRTHDGDEFRRLGGVLGASRDGIPERHGVLSCD